MEINKLFRTSAAILLAFGWLFMADARGVVSPLDQAYADIQQLDKDVEKLVNKNKTQELINIAHSKYESALSTKSAKDMAESAYQEASQNEANALSNKNSAQSAVDEQTPIRNSAYTEKENKRIAYESAQLSLNNHISTYGNGGNQGVYFRIYPLSRDPYGVAYLSGNAGLMCHGYIPTFDAWAGWGGICGLSQNIIGIFQSTFTVPAGIDSVRFAGNTDDGFRLYVDGVLATSQWREQGATWSPYTQWYDTSVDKTLDLEVWWYNGGGPGSMTLGWMTPQYLTGIPTEYLAYGTPLTSQQISERQALIEDRDTKYSQYQTSLAAYNTENNKLLQYQSTLTEKSLLYTSALQSKESAQNNLNLANYNYETALYDVQQAIINARLEYEKQFDFEEQQRIAAAIAQAAANQSQPTPEPTTIDPTPEPSPEQTKPVDPTPTPEPETTNEPTPEPTVDPKPTSEPSPKPSPQPSDINPSPTSEPKPTPAQPSSKPSQSNTITQETANLLADLTSKDTLTKLTSEQKAAVASALGVSTQEIAKVAELAKSDPIIGEALKQFADLAKQNSDAPMPYTLADATTELQTEAFLSDPLGAVFNINPAELLSNFSELGMDMTDDQREKAQEVIIPVVLVSNIVSTVIGMRR